MTPIRRLARVSERVRFRFAASTPNERDESRATRPNSLRLVYDSLVSSFLSLLRGIILATLRRPIHSNNNNNNRWRALRTDTGRPKNKRNEPAHRHTHTDIHTAAREPTLSAAVPIAHSTRAHNTHTHTNTTGLCQTQ